MGLSRQQMLQVVVMLCGVSTVTESEASWASALLMAAGVVLLVVFARRQSKLEAPMLRVETSPRGGFATR